MILKFLKINDDLVTTAQKLIKNIFKIVGINDVFGNDPRRVTPLSIVCILLFTVTFIYFGSFSQIVYLVKMFPDPTEMFKALDCLSATSVPLSKYIFMWTAREQLKIIFALCRSGMDRIPKETSAYSVFLSTQQKATLFSWFVITNQMIIHLLYVLVPIVMTLVYNKRYLPITPAEPYGLTPRYETPFFEATYVITTFATAFSAVNQTGYIVLFITIIAHEVGHFYVITETLTTLHKQLSLADKDVIKEPTKITQRDRETQKTLIFCIKHHQFIAEYHKVVRNLYKGIFAAHFAMMIVVLVTTLQTMKYWDFRNTLLTGLTGITPLFLYCFGGELLISACFEMSTALYSCGWEMMSPKNGRLVLMMLRISQKPYVLTAADIFPMNRKTFSDVVQIVYKVYTVFQ